MIETSQSIAKLAEALAAAQGEIEGARKGSVNPHFKSRYADLDSTWNACRQQLSKHGLSVVQFPCDDEAGKIGITTRLMHSSGEWIQGSIGIKMSQETNPQNAGSILTYLRRYSLQGAVGISPEDDDGNAAASPGQAGGSYRIEPTEDLDGNVVASLTLAKGLEELAKAWGEIPVGQRRLYSRVKDEAKERIAKGDGNG
jgi:hypothetical protein